MYATSAAIRREIATLVRPPARMKVSEASAKHVYVQTSGGGTKLWDPTLTPYMVEPMDLITSREYQAIVFVGPARTGKSQALVDNGLAYGVACDPCDQMLMHISQVKAADFSKLRIDRTYRSSPTLAKLQSRRSQDDNVYEKFYKAGNVIKLVWPSKNQVASSEYKRVYITDYDRIALNIDGEGSAYIMGSKRTETYMSSGMTIVESSPGREISDPKWQKKTPHEAPPAPGIMALYNQGDRRRRYWQCPHCREYFFSPCGLDAYNFNNVIDLAGNTDPSIMGTVRLVCTENGCLIDADHKFAMNLGGLWVPEGCRIEREGKNYGLAGESRVTGIASFWLTGAYAAYQSWQSIVGKNLSAQREYEITGDEESLKATVNVDDGAPYLPRRLESEISASDIQNRSEDGLLKRMVPAGVRFLVASVDVQGNKFIVQVTGYGVDYENWLIDRFEIYISEREREGQPLQLDPAGYEEDWLLITSKVIKRNYPLADNSGRKMSVFITACDSGGKAGVTDRAYKYWRKLKAIGLHNRFMLVKGERPGPQTRKPLVTKSYPDNTHRKDRKATARGDVPLWLLNTTLLKDAVSADLKRTDVGPGYMHFPDWLKLAFYEELVAEVRSERGWDNPGVSRNESFDLCAYSKGAIAAVLVDNKIQQIDWDNPPSWAANWDNNSQIDKTITESSVKIKRATPIRRPQSADRKYRYEE